MRLSATLLSGALLAAPAIPSHPTTPSEDKVVTLDVGCRLYVVAPDTRSGSLVVKQADGSLVKKLDPLGLAGECVDLAPGQYRFAFAPDPRNRNLALELSFVETGNPYNMFSATFTQTAGGPLTLVYAGSTGGGEGDKRARVSLNNPKDFLAFQ
ncbi:MAG: hypothetical protein ABSH53_17385 [Holophaga sp.]|jgi:hypothetical protein